MGVGGNTVVTPAGTTALGVLDGVVAAGAANCGAETVDAGLTGVGVTIVTGAAGAATIGLIAAGGVAIIGADTACWTDVAVELTAGTVDVETVEVGAVATAG